VKHLLAVGLLLPAAAAGAPLTFETALPVAQHSFVARTVLVNAELDGRGLPGNPEVRANEFMAALGYGLAPRLAAFATLPYLRRSMRVDSDGGRVARRVQGVGDPTGFLRYTLYQRDSPGGTLRLAPVAGVKAPVATDDEADALGPLPRAFQRSSGGWDGFAASVLTRQTLAWQFDAQALYRINGAHAGFAPGNEARLDASLQYRLWPRRLEGGNPGFTYLLLESGLARRGRDRRDGQAEPSGGTQWTLTPGLQYIAPRWVAEAGVQWPLVQNVRGLELERAVVLSLRANF
jgi:hypothetical protein